jgi:hypothetical protein
MPRSSHSPDTPVPVPISATAFAPIAEARNDRADPAPGEMGTTPTSSARRRAAARWSSSLRWSSANARLAAVVMTGSSVDGVRPAYRREAAEPWRPRRKPRHDGLCVRCEECHIESTGNGQVVLCVLSGESTTIDP